MDTDRPDDEATAYEPIEVDASVSATNATVTAEAPRSRLPLATLAGLGLVIVGIVAWAALYVAIDRAFPGITVVMALVIGYVVREVSRRSDLAPRIIAAALTAVLCVVGAYVAAVADVAAQQDIPILDTVREQLRNAWVFLKAYHWITWVIFAAAVVVAFVSASPAGSKQKAKPAPARDDEDDDQPGALPPVG